MLRMKTVNDMVDDNYELVKGKDYLYFVYDDGVMFETHSVSVPRLNSLNFDQWIEEFKSFRNSVEAQKEAMK